jgi:hypothetical protein
MNFINNIINKVFFDNSDNSENSENESVLVNEYSEYCKNLYNSSSVEEINNIYKYQYGPILYINTSSIQSKNPIIRCVMYNDFMDIYNDVLSNMSIMSNDIDGKLLNHIICNTSNININQTSNVDYTNVTKNDINSDIDSLEETCCNNSEKTESETESNSGSVYGSNNGLDSEELDFSESKIIYEMTFNLDSEKSNSSEINNYELEMHNKYNTYINNLTLDTLKKIIDIYDIKYIMNKLNI